MCQNGWRWKESFHVLDLLILLRTFSQYPIRTMCWCMCADVMECKTIWKSKIDPIFILVAIFLQLDEHFIYSQFFIFDFNIFTFQFIRLCWLNMNPQWHKFIPFTIFGTGMTFSDFYNLSLYIVYFKNHNDDSCNMVYATQWTFSNINKSRKHWQCHLYATIELNVYAFVCIYAKSQLWNSLYINKIK